MRGRLFDAKLVKQVNNILKIFKIYSHNEKNCKKKTMTKMNTIAKISGQISPGPPGPAEITGVKIEINKKINHF